MSDNYIKIKELVKNYGSFRALDKISLDLNAGEYVSLLGPNGAGKTTLFQILTGSKFEPEVGDVESRIKKNLEFSGVVSWIKGIY